jgi:regulator of cell morphogenesis and NO signaling
MKKNRQTHLERDLADSTIAEIVRDDYRTADVFKNYGLNYCCGGLVTLKAACALKNLDCDLILSELNAASRTVLLPNNLCFNEWRAAFLIEYIQNIYHAYLQAFLPMLGNNLAAFANSHKKQYPFLPELEETVHLLRAALTEQMTQEEDSIFPYIRQLDSAYRDSVSYGGLLVRTLNKPIRHLEKKYEQIEAHLMDIRNLTGYYKIPDNACTSHRVVWSKLQELDNNLVQYIYLKKNILLPKAIDIENRLLTTN